MTTRVTTRVTTKATLKSLAALTVLAAFLMPAAAQTNLPPTWVFARAYGAWQIQSTQPSTYSWNGNACSFTPFNNGISPTFFDFSGPIAGVTVYNPVFVRDASPSLNEIVTPTSTTYTSASCGFAASLANAHTTFTVTSGTGGLQEAITNSAQSGPVFNVILDRYWYQSLAGLSTAAAPNGPNPQTVIAALTGATSVGLVDTTTTPWTYYAWNGSKYAATAAASGATAFTSVTPVAVPAAVSTSSVTGGILTTATTGGTIPASSTYRLAQTCVSPLGGETTISIDTASTATIATGSGTATNTITLTSPVAATGCVGWRLYMSAASGASLSEILYASSCATPAVTQFTLNGVCAMGTSATVTAIITGTAKIPAISSAFQAPATNSPLQTVMASYPPFTNVATISAGATGTVGAVNLPAGYMNTLGRTLEICGTGFATTNSTTGTLTFATTLASIPGVTTITPFTAVSGTTTGSAVVNFTFCEWWTTTATGTTGTLEAHGTVAYNLAGTAVTSPVQDLIVAASSAVDLTKQDQIAFTLVPTTTAVTTGGAQLRQLTILPIQ